MGISVDRKMEQQPTNPKFEGTDLNLSLTTGTGVSKKDAKPSDPQPKMKLTAEEQEIYDGKHGEIKQKAMRTIVSYGEWFGAEKLVDLTGPVHMALSWGSGAIAPLLEIYEEIIDAGIKTYKPFSANPMPMDHENLAPAPEKREEFDATYTNQERLIEDLVKLGLIDRDSFSCSSYLPEAGNTPKKGDYLAWTESSAINYSNSVIGSRTNRNSVGMDMLCNILGKAPYFGLMTDEGRKAKWLIDVRTKKRPRSMVLGSAIGLKVLEDIPYIIGVDKFLDELPEEQKLAWLKDMGATTASNGAVGLYHVEGATPEAIEKGRDLLVDDYQTYVIDDEELDRIYNSYPNLWPEGAKPEQVFVGCPHFTVEQLRLSAVKLGEGLKQAGIDKPVLPVYLFAGKKVADAFATRYPKEAKFFEDVGVKIAHNCPVMYMQTPVISDEPIITSSNKCRVYSIARFFYDKNLMHIVTTGELPKEYQTEEEKYE